MKYRKQALVIDAVQWHKPGDHPEVRIANPQHKLSDGSWSKEVDVIYYVSTPDGRMAVFPGDWIITGAMGEHDVCRDSVFKITYEVVE